MTSEDREWLTDIAVGIAISLAVGTVAVVIGILVLS